MPEKQIQDYLFQRIREKLPATVSLADAVADTLHLSTDSAYRRIRGETPLVLEEARQLCSSYQLSLDEALNQQGNSVSFQVVSLQSDEKGFENYLRGLLQSLLHIASFGQKEIIYLSKDIPFFHNFYFRPLFAFRHFFWMKSIVQHPDFVHRQFSLDCLTPDIEALGKEILNVYSTIPSTEIWNSESINSTILQIEYYREAGFFSSKEDIAQVYTALRQSMEHLEQQVEAGCKFLPGENPQTKKENFAFYHNRVVLGDNTILVLLDDKKALYLNYDVLNYMMTQDEVFCNEVHDKLKNLIRRSTILSNVSEKQRHQFFNHLYRKLPTYDHSIPSNSLPK